MPNLLNFFENNGTFLSNDHTPLIAHTADDILTTYSGLYGDRQVMPISNSYQAYNTDGPGGTYGQPDRPAGHPEGRRAGRADQGRAERRGVLRHPRPRHRRADSRLQGRHVRVRADTRVTQRVAVRAGDSRQWAGGSDASTG
jgi:hypothetical protein